MGVFCPWCRRENGVEYAFCVACGRGLPTTATDGVETSTVHHTSTPTPDRETAEPEVARAPPALKPADDPRSAAEDDDNRIEAYVDRKRRYYSNVLKWTSLYASRNGKRDATEHGIRVLRDTVVPDLKPMHAGRSLTLALLTLGLWGIVVQYRLNRAWNQLQYVEAGFYDGLNAIWRQLGLVPYPLHFETDPSKKRSFAPYLLLIPVTLGIWGLVWDNRLRNDPNSPYPEIHGLEGTVVRTIRQAAPTDDRPAPPIAAGR